MSIDDQNKYLAIVVLLGFFIGGVLIYQDEPVDDFKFDHRVTIVSGFYEGRSGTVVKTHNCLGWGVKIDGELAWMRIPGYHLVPEKTNEQQ